MADILARNRADIRTHASGPSLPGTDGYYVRQRFKTKDAGVQNFARALIV
jgi:hypothetical protein